MKRVMSLLILIAILFLGSQYLINKFTKKYEINYKLYSEDLTLNIKEKYEKKNNDTYDVEIELEGVPFYFEVENVFNKQKKIIKDVLIFRNGNDICLYPILRNNKGLYLECSSNNTLYSAYSYGNQEFISGINNVLEEKGYVKHNDAEESKVDYQNNLLYVSNLNKNDSIIVWQYQGIIIMNKDKQEYVNAGSFDKYENTLGTLVGKYYVVPNYVSQKLLEFNYVFVTNVETFKQERYKLENTLSSDTYVNGVIGDKMYFTDPTNLVQIEYKPKGNEERLLGNEQIGGQDYDGSWKSRNIYDFKSSKIKFRETTDLDNYNYNYVDVKKGNGSYYFYTNDGSIYQVPINHPDKSILLYRASGLSNFNVVDNNIYYLVDDTLYYFDISNGIEKVLTNKDFKYNNHNRISIYRKK